MKRLFQSMALLTTFACSSLLADTIFITNFGAGTIGEYTTTGATVNAALISGLFGPSGIPVSGSDLFEVNFGAGGIGTVGEYTTSGATVNASLISELNNPFGVALSGTNLFISTSPEALFEFTTSGAFVNGLSFGLAGTESLAVSGSDLFAGNTLTGTIGEYTTSLAYGEPIADLGAAGPHTRLALRCLDRICLSQTLPAGTIGEYTTSGAYRERIADLGAE